MLHIYPDCGQATWDAFDEECRLLLQMTGGEVLRKHHIGHVWSAWPETFRHRSVIRAIPPYHITWSDDA